MGGREAIEATRTLVLEGEADEYTLGQGPTPEGELPRFQATGLRREVDLVRRRWRWPWISSGALTGLVGVARIFSGKHFPSDVLVGAPAGTVIGLVVPSLHTQAGASKRASAKLRDVRRWRAAARGML